MAKRGIKFCVLNRESRNPSAASLGHDSLGRFTFLGRHTPVMVVDETVGKIPQRTAMAFEFVKY
jgi:hypothetical protein